MGNVKTEHQKCRKFAHNCHIAEDAVESNPTIVGASPKGDVVGTSAMSSLSKSAETAAEKEV
jgi:hypothetical protein